MCAYPLVIVPSHSFERKLMNNLLQLPRIFIERWAVACYSCGWFYSPAGWAGSAINTDHTSEFDTLLQNNNDTCNHHRNIQTLMIEIYKMKNNLNPPIMDNMFERRNNTYFQEFATTRKKTVKTSLETLNYKSPQLWSILPENLRQINLLLQFKESVRKWVCIDCPFRLCKLYLPNIGFL